MSSEGRGVSGAVVTNIRTMSRTNMFGYYAMTIPNCGQQTISIRAKGYPTLTANIWLPVADTNVVNTDFILLTQ